MARIKDDVLAELIENEGELRTGPVSTVGVLRLALDLQEARATIARADAAGYERGRKEELGRWVSEFADLLKDAAVAAGSAGYGTSDYVLGKRFAFEAALAMLLKAAPPAPVGSKGEKS